MSDVDQELRSVITAIEGRVRNPVGRSIHVHQLDGARTEAMVYLDAAGARIDWLHGKGDCAVTGEGAAIVDVLTGRGDAATLEASGRLVLYGDRDLVQALSTVFG